MILIAVLCTLSGECEEYRSPLPLAYTNQQCMLAVQQVLSQPNGLMPDWQVKVAYCEPRKRT